MRKQQSNIESAPGTPWRIIIITLSIILFSIVESIGFYRYFFTSNNNTDDALFLMQYGLAVLFTGLIGLIFFPNTYRIKIVNDSIEVSFSNTKRELIKLSRIKKITPSKTFVTSGLGIHDFYRIDFFDKTKFGRTVHFKCKRKRLTDTSDFGKKLKYEWAKHRKEMIAGNRKNKESVFSSGSMSNKRR